MADVRGTQRLDVVVASRAQAGGAGLQVVHGKVGAHAVALPIGSGSRMRFEYGRNARPIDASVSEL